MKDQGMPPPSSPGVVGSQGRDDGAYRKIVDQAHEGIWTIDTNGCTTFVNRRMAEMLGYTDAEMAGRPHTDFMSNAEPSLRR